MVSEIGRRLSLQRHHEITAAAERRQRAGPRPVALKGSRKNPGWSGRRDWQGSRKAPDVPDREPSLVAEEVPARTVIDDEVVGVGCRRAGMKECRVEVRPKVEAREDRLVESDIVVAVDEVGNSVGIGGFQADVEQEVVIAGTAKQRSFPSPPMISSIPSWPRIRSLPANPVSPSPPFEPTIVSLPERRGGPAPAVRPIRKVQFCRFGPAISWIAPPAEALSGCTIAPAPISLAMSASLPPQVGCPKPPLLAPPAIS